MYSSTTSSQHMPVHGSYSCIFPQCCLLPHAQLEDVHNLCSDMRGELCSSHSPGGVKPCFGRRRHSRPLLRPIAFLPRPDCHWLHGRHLRRSLASIDREDLLRFAGRVSLSLSQVLGSPSDCKVKRRKSTPSSIYIRPFPEKKLHDLCISQSVRPTMLTIRAPAPVPCCKTLPT